jgi:hypothetical protein
MSLILLLLLLVVLFLLLLLLLLLLYFRTFTHYLCKSIKLSEYKLKVFHHLCL